MDQKWGNETGSMKLVRKIKKSGSLGKEEASKSLPHLLRAILAPDPAPEFLHKRPVMEWPAAQVFENKDSLWVLMDLPGVEKEMIQISVRGETVLIVEGQRKMLEMPVDARCRLNERFPDRFRRQFELGVGCVTSKIKAVIELGTLRIEIPKEQGFAPCLSMEHFKKRRP